MMKYNTKMGLEIHLCLQTKQKAFSCSPTTNDSNVLVNTHINNIDLGRPGTLPQINKDALRKLLLLGYILNCDLASEVEFKRKNYFYPDLPKGFQISQFETYCAENGVLDLLNAKINIRNLQLEEDTAKQIKVDNQVLLDFNRCGNPLIELITQPDFTTFEEVNCFINIFKAILIFFNISDARFEAGEIRIDLNLSLYDDDFSTSRCEVKNLNSLKSLHLAIKEETKVQLEYLKSRKINNLLTKSFDDKSKKLITLREKMLEEDYTFIFEPNLPVIKLNEKEMSAIKGSVRTKKQVFYQFKQLFLENNEKIGNLNYLLHNYLFMLKEFEANPSQFKALLQICSKNDIAIDIYRNKLFVDFLTKTKFKHEAIKYIVLLNQHLDNPKVIEDFYAFYLKHLNLDKSELINILKVSATKDIDFNTVYSKKSLEKISDEDILDAIKNCFLEEGINKQLYLENTNKYSRKIMGSLMKKYKGKISPQNIIQTLNRYTKNEQK